MRSVTSVKQSLPTAAPWTTATFGDCTLHLGHRELSRGDRKLALEPKAFELLVHLIQQRHRTVTKDELFAACWEGIVPTDGALARTIVKIRQATGDFDSAAPIIMTVHRVGYRFVGAVAFDVPAGPGPALMLAVPALQTRRIVLLPLANMTGDDSLSWVRLGLVSLMAKSLQTLPGFSLVPVSDVLSAVGSARNGESVERQVDPARASLGASICIWGELHGAYGRLLLHFNLHGLDDKVLRGTVVGSDAAKIAIEAAMHLRSWLIPGDVGALPDTVNFQDDFLNQVFARAIQHSREDRLLEAEHLFAVLEDADANNPRVLLESTGVAVALGRPHASALLTRLESVAQGADSQWLIAMLHELRARHLELRGHLADSVTETLKAIEISTAQGYNDLTVRLMVTCSGRMAMASDDRAEAMLSRVIPDAERLGNRVVLCDAYCAAARVAGFRNDWSTALRHQTAAVVIARTMHEASRSWAYGGLSWVQTSLGQLNAAADSASDAFRMGRISGAQPQQGLAAGQAVLALLAKRRIREMAQLFEDMRGLPSDTSVAMQVARDVYCRSTLLAACGRIDEALQIFYAIGEEIDAHPRLKTRSRAHYLALLLRAGRFDELEAAFESMREAASFSSDYRLGPQIEYCEAMVDHFCRRDTKAALAQLHAIVDTLAASEVHAQISLDCAWIHLERKEVSVGAALVLHQRRWLEESPTGLLVAARLRYELNDFAGAVSIQKAYFAEYSQTWNAFHAEHLAVYEASLQTGKAATIAELPVPISMHWHVTDELRRELPAALGGSDSIA